MTPTGTAPHASQNTAKNNFCASGAAVPVTNFTFRRLQQQIIDQRADIECCGQTLPANRTLLLDLHTTDDNHKVGEGTVVQIIGFLIKGKYSNVGKNKGESVNCHFEDREENDVHMNIVKSKPSANPTKKQLETLECESVIAEVSPHFRPELWEPLGRLVKTTEKTTAAKKIAALDLDRPMRFTGQAFFDASHRPCVNGKPQESSERVSSWEIHPVYRVEVCTNASLSGRAPDRTDVWVSLDPNGSRRMRKRTVNPGIHPMWRLESGCQMCGYRRGECRRGSLPSTAPRWQPAAITSRRCQLPS